MACTSYSSSACVWLSVCACVSPINKLQQREYRKKLYVRMRSVHGFLNLENHFWTEYFSFLYVRLTLLCVLVAIRISLRIPCGDVVDGLPAHTHARTNSVSTFEISKKSEIWRITICWFIGKTRHATDTTRFVPRGAWILTMRILLVCFTLEWKCSHLHTHTDTSCHDHVEYSAANT